MLFVSVVRSVLASKGKQPATSHVAVFSLFPLPNAVATIAMTLGAHGGVLHQRDRYCSRCDRCPGDLMVPLDPLQYDALLANAMSAGVSHSRLRVSEFYVNPPGNDAIVICVSLLICLCVWGEYFSSG